MITRLRVKYKPSLSTGSDWISVVDPDRAVTEGAEVRNAHTGLQGMT
jgi:hypothetical protein